MIDMLNIFAVLSNKVGEIVDEITKKTNVRGENLYTLIMDLISQAFYSTSIFYDDNLEANVLWRDVVLAIKELIDLINKIQNRYMTLLPKLYSIALDRLKSVVLLSKTIYVIFCDALSLIEAIYFAITFRERLRFITILINPGGNTLTYKYIISTILGESINDLTLETISKYISLSLNAKDYAVFREIDKAVHELNEVTKEHLIARMFTNVRSLTDKINYLMEDYNATIIVLADHGYDIKKIESGHYTLEHRWKTLKSLSIIAPIIVVG